MKDMGENVIGAAARHGDKVVLTNFWRDSDVICPNSKIFYLTDGEIVITTKNERVVAGAGDMVIIPAGTRHDFNLSEKNHASKYWLHADLTLDGKNLFDYFPLPYKTHVGQNDALAQLFDTVLRLKGSTRLADKLTASAALLSIVTVFAESCGMDEGFAAFDEIDSVVNYINDNYKEKFTLDGLCEYARLSKGYFLRRFKKRTGYSPMHYVNRLKIDKAKTMILQSERPINEIMEELGFYDAAHFSKLFKSHTGYSPKKYKEQNVYLRQNTPIK